MGTKMVTALRKGEDSESTAHEAVRAALAKLKNHKPDLAVCYCSPEYDYGKVLATIRNETGNAPLIGCSSAGEFTEEEVATGSIAIALISSDTHKFFTTWGDGLRKDPEACLEKAVAKVPTRVDGYPRRSFLIYVDGLAGKGEESVLAAMTKLGTDVRFAGGCAGDDLKLKETYVFCDDKVLQDSVALCLWASKSAPPIAVHHGHVPLSPLLTFTKVKANVLHEVDGKPAWDVWKEHIRDAAKELLGLDVDRVTDTTEMFRILGAFEAGLLVADDSYKMRSPLSKNDDGSLNFTCSIYEGSKFRIMKTTAADQIVSAGETARHALENEVGIQAAGALTFDCAARLMILGKEFPKSVEAIKHQLGPKIPLLGYEAYGEICMHEGEVSGLHNTTTVISIIPD